MGNRKSGERVEQGAALPRKEKKENFIVKGNQKMHRGEQKRQTQVQDSGDPKSL